MASNEYEQTSIGVTQFARLDAICTEYEQHWQQNTPGPLLEYLDQVRPEWRKELLRLLVDLDLDLRRQRDGEPPGREYYVQELPGYTKFLDQIWPPNGELDPRASARAERDSVNNDDVETVDLQPSADKDGALVSGKIKRFQLIERAGKGSFGTVYRAFDEQLKRDVAIKISHEASDSDLELKEAQATSAFHHPALVPVYEVDRTDDGRMFIVSLYVHGTNLKKRLADHEYSLPEAVRLVAVVGEALHLAHQHGLVHRDVKPANILIDRRGEPLLTDFGLALRLEETGTGPKLAGSPAYMSPEQARREGHLVDARSDVFSLCVVLYQMVTREVPFQKTPDKTLLEVIQEAQPIPPTQRNPQIPKELERIILRGLARRARDRYATAGALVEDLRAWLADPAAGAAQAADASDDRVIPKGLLSFDEQDARFYQRLIPGIRDRHGLPEGITYWKARVESEESPFRMGVLYGPSGSGKSSFVQAGLLPHLDSRILTCQVRATPEGTESDLLVQLRRTLPALAGESDLVRALRSVRGDDAMSRDQKLLIVIDQFEQWLSGRRNDAESELITALRQCDGHRVQCLLLVRDDYWSALSHFAEAVELELSADNCQLVPVFDAEHARKVLTEFGRAYARLPLADSELSSEQVKFLELTIRDMALRGQLIPVRLVLLADVFRHRDWVPAELRRVGGVQGAMSVFLDELVSGEAADPTLSAHADATARLLRALLPPPGLSIKGRPRTAEDLQELAGDSPEQVTAILKVLQDPYRLVTSAAATEAESEAQPEYQLAHDYLVPIVRDWSARRQRDTVRGRLESLLADRTATWKVAPEQRSLPSIGEWLAISTLMPRARLSEASRKMMRAANVFYLTRVAIVALLCIATLAGGTIWWSHNRAREYMERLTAASTAEVPEILTELEGTYVGRLVMEKFRRGDHLVAPADVEQSEEWQAGAARRKLHAAMVLGDGSTLLDYLGIGVEQNSDVRPVAPVHVRDVAQTLPTNEERVEHLWGILKSSTDPNRQRRLAATMIELDREADWSSIARPIAVALVKSPSSELGDWVRQLMPIRAVLTPHLLALFDSELADAQQEHLAEALAKFASDETDVLVEALVKAEPNQLASLNEALVLTGEQACKKMQDCLSGLVNVSESVEQWQPVSQDVAKLVERHCGYVGSKGAFIQTLPLEHSPSLLANMATSGFRPVTFRPYAVQGGTYVAIGWCRDGRKFQAEHGLTAEQLRQRSNDGMQLIDICCYRTSLQEMEPMRFAATWVATEKTKGTRLYIDVPYEVHQRNSNKYKLDDQEPIRLFERTGVEGIPLYSALWQDQTDRHASGTSSYIRYADKFKNHYRGYLNVECQLRAVDLTRRDLTDPYLHCYENESKGDVLKDEYLWTLIRDLLLLGRPNSCVLLSQRAVTERPSQAWPSELRLRTLADLGQHEAMQDEITRASTAGVGQATIAMLKLRAALAVGDVEQAIEHLDEFPQDASSTARSRLARAYSLLAGAVEDDSHTATRYRDQALGLMEGHSYDFRWALRDSDYDALRADPRFQRGIHDAGRSLRYSALWLDTEDTESNILTAEDVGRHAASAQSMLQSGFWPHAVSARFLPITDQIVAASVWHRRFLPANERFDLAASHANLAIALAMTGDESTIVDALMEKFGRQTSTEVIHRAAGSGLSARRLVDLLGNGGDAVLQRHLLASIGAYDPVTLEASGAKRALQTQIAALKATTTDAGVRSAIAWCLGRFPTLENTVGAEARGNWTENSVGQTMISLSPPSKILIGSPVWENGRAANETQRVREIRGDFELSSTEVTVQQFRQFLSDESVRNHYLKNKARGFDYSGKKAPDPKCPQIDVSYFDAIRFCEWLSQKEGIDADRSCYPGVFESADGSYVLPVDPTTRYGYRLPTDAEWEYACRAGALELSRHFGDSNERLAQYGWFVLNSDNKAHPVGGLMPNEFGFFDMLGNVMEWCHDADRPWHQEEDRTMSFSLSLQTKRLMRGGAFDSFGDDLRSASRRAFVPATQNPALGFRVARTLMVHDD